MTEVPRIVRERLQAQGAGEHPDANLLSAFAEHRLADAERVQVLEHLSGCAPCREVAALITAGAEEPQTVFRPQRVNRWWKSPVVHWSALLTAAVVVLVAVLLGPHRQRSGYSASAPATASQPESAVVSQAAPEPPSAPSQQPPASQTEVRKKSELKQAKPAPAPPAGIGPRRADGVGAGTGGGMMGGVVAARPPQVQTPPAPPPPPIQESAKTAGAMQDRAAMPAANAAPAPSAANEALDVTAAGARQRENAVLLQRAPSAMRVSRSMRWSVSPSGSVQRSSDAGRTWKDVTIAEGVSFRAVSAVGEQVWAGGSGGALYHSADNGEHWSPVAIPGLSGNVVRIEFTDPARGTVTTSTGETWATSDGGQSWRRE